MDIINVFIAEGYEYEKFIAKRNGQRSQVLRKLRSKT